MWIRTELGTLLNLSQVAHIWRPADEYLAFKKLERVAVMATDLNPVTHVEERGAPIAYCATAAEADAVIEKICAVLATREDVALIDLRELRKNPEAPKSERPSLTTS